MNIAFKQDALTHPVAFYLSNQLYHKQRVELSKISGYQQFYAYFRYDLLWRTRHERPMADQLYLTAYRAYKYRQHSTILYHPGVTGGFR